MSAPIPPPRRKIKSRRSSGGQSRRQPGRQSGFQSDDQSEEQSRNKSEGQLGRPTEEQFKPEKVTEGQPDGQTNSVGQTEEQPGRQYEEVGLIGQPGEQPEQEPVRLFEKQYKEQSGRQPEGQSGILHEGLSGIQAKELNVAQSEEQCGRLDEREETIISLEDSLFKNGEQPREITSDQKSTFQKVLDGIKKAKDYVKKSIIKNEEKDEDLSALENGGSSGQNGGETQHLTSVQRLRKVTSEGSNGLRKVLGDVKTRVTKTDKPQKGQVGGLETVVSTKSSCLGNGEQFGETKDVALKNIEQSGETKNAGLAESSLLGKCKQPGEISAQLKNVTSPESSFLEKGEQLGEKSAEAGNVTVADAYESLMIKKVEFPGKQSREELNLTPATGSPMLESAEQPDENVPSVQSLNFQKVWDSVEKILDGPTSEETVIMTSACKKEM